MRWIWRAALAAVLLTVTVFWFAHALNQPFDTDDPDYAWISTELKRFADFADGRDDLPPHAQIDVLRLNGGDWSSACLIGGESDPVKVVVDLMSGISETERLRLQNANTHPDHVGEYGFVAAYLGTDGTVRFIRLAQGIGNAGLFFKKCISRPDTVIMFQ